MTESIIVNESAAAITPAHDLPPGLFDSFISFIDRGAKTTKTYITNLRQFAAWLAYKAILRPARADILLYRDYLSAEHEAIQLDPNSATGWKYRTDGSGNRYKVICKPNTIKQYLHNDTQRQEAETAQRLYNLYHGITDQNRDNREKLESILQTMTGEQLEQLTGIAAAIAKP